MNTAEFIGCILMDLSRMSQQRRLATRMPLQNASCIVYLPINHNPAIIVCAMLLDLLSRELLLGTSSVLLGVCNLQFRGFL